MTDDTEAGRRRVSLDRIEAGVRHVAEKHSKDDQDRLEEAALSRHRAETARITESNLDARVNRRMRNNYAKAVFCFLIGYCAFAGVIVLLEGWHLFGFGLPVVALTALVGSTAVSAIGLVGIVVSGLFKPMAAASSYASKTREK